MRDVSNLSVAAVQRLFRAATGRRLSELVSAYADDERPGVRDAVSAARKRLDAARAEARRVAALYRIEADLHRSGIASIAGVDEVGRGAIAGPLTVAACVLPPRPHILGLDDSKRLRPQQRAEVAERVRQCAVAFAVVHVPASHVDARGLAVALRGAMRDAVSSLEIDVDHVVVDGNPVGLFEHETAVVGGDRTVAAVAAASVLAKVERDRLMCELSAIYPEYGFHIHKGYGTSDHLGLLEAHGPCPEHRRSFSPGGGTGRLF